MLQDSVRQLKTPVPPMLEVVALESFFPPPTPSLEESRSGKRYLIERLLNHRDVNGRRTSYLVRWRG
uniref:Chromo domain-containing protein n=1 Tax=Peronospora matthiolae TaxID=2874970 RepID=A0AAV1V071_9STRA